MSLPILVSVPHGGSATPSEIGDRVCITREDLFDDGDASTPEIYDLRGRVLRVQVAEVARAFVDLNRAPDDRPPANPDGVVKTATCYGRPIYKPGSELGGALIDRLLAAYYEPYHRALEGAARDGRLRLALDCHSMAAEPPAVAPDSAPRPLFCLSNVDGATAPASLMEQVRRALSRSFECDESQIGLNDPFHGGFITRSHGGRALPWIQVEMNRSLYLAEPWFDRSTLIVDPARLGELRTRFLAALEMLVLD